MKKIIVAMAILALLAFACTPKASPAVTEATIPSETAVSKDVATIEEGNKIFTTKCTRCHKEKPIQKWTYEKLRPVLGTMVRKAKLNNTEIAEVAAYVHAHAKQ